MGVFSHPYRPVFPDTKAQGITASPLLAFQHRMAWMSPDSWPNAKENSLSFLFGCACAFSLSVLRSSQYVFQQLSFWGWRFLATPAFVSTKICIESTSEDKKLSLASLCQTKQGKTNLKKPQAWPPTPQSPTSEFLWKGIWQARLLADLP